ncbi:extensin [Iris pallida]|uniref:Extensin n=1 Tax=Iris pallida TaxID=29817 RepID=A0AAX6I3Q6_IRIPA|nr:extensin [Iris pallida]
MKKTSEERKFSKGFLLQRRRKEKDESHLRLLAAELDRSARSARGGSNLVPAMGEQLEARGFGVVHGYQPEKMHGREMSTHVGNLEDWRLENRGLALTVGVDTGVAQRSESRSMSTVRHRRRSELRGGRRPRRRRRENGSGGRARLGVDAGGDGGRVCSGEWGFG